MRRWPGAEAVSHGHNLGQMPDPCFPCLANLPPHRSSKLVVHQRENPRVSVMTWRVRLTSALSEMLGGALLGWTLSLTQGSRIHHWPWAVVGGVLVLAVGLTGAKIMSRRRAGAHASEDQRSDVAVQSNGVIIHARQMINGRTGAILARGAGAFIDIVSDDFSNSGVVRVDEGSPGLA
jgi:hypothetical protein